jgi:hypothetical protein
MEMAFESDWIFLQAAEPGLQDYLLSKELYRPLLLPPRAPRNIQIPQLTIGSLLLSQARLSAIAPEPARQAELDGLKERIALVRSKWRVNWSRKAEREYSARLRLWGQYLHDLRADPRANAAAYPSEIRQRAILRLLAPELLERLPQDDVEQTNQMDSVLRGLTQPGPFVWEPEIEPAFPWDGYWFLYMQIQK